MNEKQKLEHESITGRVVEFLCKHKPFDLLTEEQLITLVSSSSLKYFAKDESVFKTDDELHTNIYVVRKGAVSIIAANNELIDKCAEGELFGTRAFMNSEKYKASAIADPDALLLCIPANKIRPMIASDARLTEYFFGDFSSGVSVRKRKLSEVSQNYQDIKGRGNLKYSFENEHISNHKTPIVCQRNESIKDAAILMKQHRVGSVIVIDENRHPIGIITDTDLRNKVIAEETSIHESVVTIMSSPVKTVASNKTSEEYLLEMVATGVHHLCVTQDGSSLSKIIGVITDHDLLVSRGNNAAVLTKELRKASEISDLKLIVQRFDHHIAKMVASNAPILQVTKIVHGFNQQLIKKVVTKAMEETSYDFSPDAFCLLALGSTARGEQIIRTDFDSAIIVADEFEHAIPQIQQTMTRFFTMLVEIGYKVDKAGIQADNNQWIKTLTDWQLEFKHWIEQPDEKALLHATIFFDLMPFYGNENLAEQLQNRIFKSYKGNHMFTAFLATNALQNPPPLGFFKNLLLEKSGENKNTFDIKARALMPLADAARLKSLEFQSMFPSNTIERYKRLSQLDQPNAWIYEDCAVAYEIFMRLRAAEGFQNQHDGRYINTGNLASLEQQILKNAFKPIREIQHLIKPV